MTNANDDRLSRVERILENLAQRQDQFQLQLEQTAVVARNTLQIAESNARSIQAWESLIEQNKIEGEEERSQLSVRLTDLEQASRENIQQHFHFQERFDQILAEIQRIWQRIAS